MATNKPQGNRVGWRINTKYFRLGKTIEISSLDEKPYLYSCQLWDSNPQPSSHSVVAFIPKLAHCPYQLATEDWLSTYACIVRP